MNYIMGVDAGLANAGLCIMAKDPDWVVKEHGVVSTAKENKKRRIFAVDDNVRRIMEFQEVAHGFGDRRDHLFVGLNSWF